MKLLTLLFFFALTIGKTFSQTVAVSATKTNVLFRGFDNPLNIVVENYPCNKIVVQTSKGILSGSGCQFTYRVEDTVSTTIIKVGIRETTGIKWLIESRYHIWPVPESIVVFGKVKSGEEISKRAILAIGGIKMQCPDIDLYECPEILSYSLIVSTKDTTLLLAKNIAGTRIPPDACDFISKNCNEGDVLTFDDMVFVYKKQKGLLPPLVLKIGQEWKPVALSPLSPYIRPMKNIAVFCGSSFGKNDIYTEQAELLGEAIAQKGLGLIYGGAKVGLMGVIANAALDAGGKVIGVLPRFLQTKEIAHTELTELVLVDTMHDRKAKMSELCDGVIAIPGGYGTMEEFFELLTWGQLGLHKKPVAILNINGFYNGLITLIDNMVNQGFLKQFNRDMLLVDDDINNLLAKMDNYTPPPVNKWISLETT